MVVQRDAQASLLVSINLISRRFPFSLTTSTSIRAPSYAKREALVIQFKTTKQAQLDGIVATLEELYSCKPIGSVAIGKAYNMEHAQVLKYLHQAKLVGRAKPVLSGPGGVIRGWIPGTIALDTTLFEQNARRITTAVNELKKSDVVVTATIVGKHLGMLRATAERWLKRSEQMKLVRWDPERGWKPAR